MNNNILSILAVVVTLLTAWLVISLASGQNSVIVAPSPAPVRTEEAGSSEVEMSVFIPTETLSTKVDIR
ncbi:hypothetical protein COY25_01670 [Candidatus Uhrbacteria bacterium CG_4_10_14_0_2_um_filter_41_7]|uniref:Uncharacterized protein n=1 Tax=Candidatus Uhrbacteria bacterium CG_4_9_14_3_um_filter_41_35 TaxID=1975034 RepID=A0A2M7XG73_9BACT|nr:MAG: hypothetical protein COV92_02250 [Candidatus Uhrbacteria bacterium CG11_big_fil_rev_8_21_14_0_20_41_9]PIZ54857.1 MAG: hypothetical protein COY25_01670 [Candidatus Uhrbacteria bacterium CG_4_10_14_0_2_um_filter_41_7]PJA46859.1 MAG: hypothetical protein CO173_01395 [Candidatus Uhrbacteria bacterium CG_4_9_14_3_um_filter_41_35]